MSWGSDRPGLPTLSELRSTVRVHGMTSMPERGFAVSATDLELRALERMIGARCKQIERVAKTEIAGNAIEQRERDFQLQVFAERRTQALDLMRGDSSEPREIRAARLERLLQALECSSDYFCREAEDAVDREEAPIWSVRVK